MRTKRVISIWSLPIFRLKYLTQSTTSKKLCFLWIQVWMLVYKLLLVEMTQKFPLRQENHVFVKVCLANFWCAIWRKIFQRDSIFVYFSTLCIEGHYFRLISRNILWARMNICFSHYFFSSFFMDLLLVWIFYIQCSLLCFVQIMLKHLSLEKNCDVEITLLSKRSCK